MFLGYEISALLLSAIVVFGQKNIIVDPTGT